MTASYIVAPQAALDLVEIWRHIKEKSGEARADRIESEIRHRFSFLARTPEAWHVRENLTDEAVKFFLVYSYLIVYRPKTKPLQIISVLHGWRDVERILKKRL
ncbi:MAG: type II toxin-antitoxin system RelE/ParE family toxin [Candidatus Acidiferrum sp.]